MLKYCLLLLICISSFGGSIMANSSDNLPVSTQWLMDATGDVGRAAINSVYMIICPSIESKGTGFKIVNGPIVTNAHVVKDCKPSEILAISANGDHIRFNRVIKDTKRDLALLIPEIQLHGGLSLADEEPEVGNIVNTWGYPLMYNGPAPLLSVGYLSGFIAEKNGNDVVKHYVVNGAFNPGNSGGPLLLGNNDKVIGVVVAKHVPFTKFQNSALEVLGKNKSGIQYNATNDKGEVIPFAESQLVADLLNHFRYLTQVMIGEAISLNELRDFLEESGYKD